MVVAVMPCRGRLEQTLDTIERLVYTSKASFKLITVSGQEDKHIIEATIKAGANGIISEKPKLSYWEALHLATTTYTSENFIVNLSNDLKPARGWLKNALISYDKNIGRDNFGMIGFNGDGLGPEDSCHFMIHRKFLEKVGGWPLCYKHNYGDTELCEKARFHRAFFKEPYAILFHDHPYFRGKKYDDHIYREGRSKLKEDEALFNQRKLHGWPLIKN